MENIRKNWIIIAFVTGLIVTWTTIGLRLSAVEVKAQENRDALSAIYQIQVDIAVMKADISFIKSQVR